MREVKKFSYPCECKIRFLKSGIKSEVERQNDVLKRHGAIRSTEHWQGGYQGINVIIISYGLAGAIDYVALTERETISSSRVNPE